MKIIKFKDDVGSVYVNLENVKIIEVRPQEGNLPMVIIRQGNSDYPDVSVTSNNVDREDLYEAEKINEIIRSFVTSSSNFIDVEGVDSDLEYRLVIY